jgi:hypothetical protein
MPNPSMFLRRLGFRWNKSVWVLPMKHVALVPLKEWTEKGAKPGVVEFAEHEEEKVVALAKQYMTKDLDETRAFVDAVVAEVRKRLDAAKALGTGTPEREKHLKETKAYAYASLYRAKQIADAVEEGALHFDITGDIGALSDALRQSIKAKSAMFFAMQNEASGITALAV